MMPSPAVLAKIKELRECPAQWVESSTYQFPYELPITADVAFRAYYAQQEPLCSSIGEFRRKLKEGALRINGDHLVNAREIVEGDFQDGVLVLSCGRHHKMWSR